MNSLIIGLKNIVYKPLSSFLSILLFGFGVAMIVIILLASSFLKSEITNNASGIDLVVGAKGSPLQIILCNIFHIDFPTGNISLEDSYNLSKNRLIASAIPVSLGDSYQGSRIVGTTKAYADLYETGLSDGEWFDKGMTAVIGSNVYASLGLKIGDQFASAHGLSEGAGGHDEHPFEVVGMLEKSGTVLDNLILVPIHSIWEVHADHEPHDHEDESLHEVVELSKIGLSVTNEQLEENDITALLVKYRSPMAAVQLPRIINGTSNLQAASPAFETARLFSIIGVGVNVLNILGIVVIIISSASVLIGLVNALKERKYELAIMRSMGASKKKIFLLIFTEGMLLTIIGTIFGFLIAHFGFNILVGTLDQVSSPGFTFIYEELTVLLGSFMIGIFASIIPSLMAMKADISETLAKA